MEEGTLNKEERARKGERNLNKRIRARKRRKEFRKEEREREGKRGRKKDKTCRQGGCSISQTWTTKHEPLPQPTGSKFGLT